MSRYRQTVEINSQPIYIRIKDKAWCERCKMDLDTYHHKLRKKLHKKQLLNSDEYLHIHIWKNNKCINGKKCKFLRDKTKVNYQIISE